MKALFQKANKQLSEQGQYLAWMASDGDETDMVVDDRKLAKKLVEVNKYDLLFLEFATFGFFTRRFATAIARGARKRNPCCVIILYVYDSVELAAPMKYLPGGLFDICLSPAYDPGWLCVLLAGLSVSRRYMVQTHQPERAARGVIYGPYSDQNRHLGRALQKAGFEMEVSDDVGHIEKGIIEYRPDLFITHCHTDENDFSRIRDLCKRVRTALPDCIILVTSFSSTVGMYNEVYGLGTFEYDFLIEPDVDHSYLLMKIYRQLIIKLGPILNKEAASVI
ncbi:hypothetical protein [Chitinophaga caseinilytica]|uniref:hypothetical protein n=1 Tax=Chitinophaga caseinilytica TaxID=2267521 RepID=UPI003C2D59A6